MYCTAPLSPRKGRLRSFRDDDDDDGLVSYIKGLNGLLTYHVIRPTQPPILHRTEDEYIAHIVWAMDIRL